MESDNSIPIRFWAEESPQEDGPVEELETPLETAAPDEEMCTEALAEPKEMPNAEKLNKFLSNKDVNLR